MADETSPDDEQDTAAAPAGFPDPAGFPSGDDIDSTTVRESDDGYEPPADPEAEPDVGDEVA